MSATVPGSRRYRGVTPAERQAIRRERLLEAGLDLFATQGFMNTSIREICGAAGLNQRYFYESFGSPEELLLATRDRIVLEIAQTAVVYASEADGLEAKARAGLTAWWRQLTDDPRKARVMFIETVGVSEELERRRLQTRHQLADFIVTEATRTLDFEVPPTMRGEAALTGRSLVGATVELMVDWINGDSDQTVDELIDHCVRMFMVASEAVVTAFAAAG